jgi:hypothetical protein
VRPTDYARSRQYRVEGNEMKHSLFWSDSSFLFNQFNQPSTTNGQRQLILLDSSLGSHAAKTEIRQTQDLDARHACCREYK